MNLDDRQKKAVAGWITEGLRLSDIQSRLNSEFGVSLTYMAVRLLVDDLKLLPKDPPPKVDKPLVAPPPQGKEPRPGIPPAAGLPMEGEAAAASPPVGTGKVTVSVDLMARPGAMVSGSVTFSDGQSAVWYLDQMGRLGIAPQQQGYKPSAPDLQAFQRALESELSKLGI